MDLHCFARFPLFLALRQATGFGFASTFGNPSVCDFQSMPRGQATRGSGVAAFRYQI